MAEESDATRIAQSILLACIEGRWRDAREHSSELQHHLDGTYEPLLPAYEVIVAVAQRDAEWFHERVVVRAGTRTLAEVKAEGDVRRARDVEADAFVRATVLGIVEIEAEHA